MNSPSYDPLAPRDDQDCNARPALRQRLIAARLALPDRDVRATALAQRLRQVLDALQPDSLGAYSAIRGEFDPLPLLAEWLRDHPHTVLALPRVDAATRSMQFVAWHPGQPLRAGAHDIPEPAGNDIVEPGTLLVPCVGFADIGLRLGYGGGYYDRYLANREEVYTIGLAWACGEIHELDMQPHDQLMDLIVTEDGLYGMDADRWTATA